MTGNFGHVVPGEEVLGRQGFRQGIDEGARAADQAPRMSRVDLMMSLPAEGRSEILDHRLSAGVLGIVGKLQLCDEPGDPGIELGPEPGRSQVKGVALEVVRSDPAADLRAGFEEEEGNPLLGQEGGDVEAAESTANDKRVGRHKKAIAITVPWWSSSSEGYR